MKLDAPTHIRSSTATGSIVFFLGVSMWSRGNSVVGGELVEPTADVKGPFAYGYNLHRRESCKNEDSRIVMVFIVYYYCPDRLESLSFVALVKCHCEINRVCCH